MGLSSHIQELRNKHDKLSEKVEEAQKGLGTDDLVIGALKKEKLKLKEEIERLAHA